MPEKLLNISHQIYFLALKFREKHFRPGLSPGPAGKAHDALLVDTLIGWGGEHHPFDILSQTGASLDQEFSITE